MIDNAWKKITAINGDVFTVDSASATTGLQKTNIVTMNELTVSPVSSMEITRLKFIYKPVFS